MDALGLHIVQPASPPTRLQENINSSPYQHTPKPPQKGQNKIKQSSKSLLYDVHSDNWNIIAITKRSSKRTSHYNIPCPDLTHATTDLHTHCKLMRRSDQLKYLYIIETQRPCKRHVTNIIKSMLTYRRIGIEEIYDMIDEQKNCSNKPPSHVQYCRMRVLIELSRLT